MDGPGGERLCANESVNTALPAGRGVSCRRPNSGEIEFRPAALAQRHGASWASLAGDVARITRREPFETAYHGASHLLVAYDRAKRHAGETIVDGFARSTRRDLSRKLVFVPAGCSFREWHVPLLLMRAVYFRLDPQSPLLRGDDGADWQEPRPRLFFSDPSLWQTVFKLQGLIDAGPVGCPLYAESLAVVLLHELLDRGARSVTRAALGGLSARQRRIVAEYIEENCAARISLVQLADVAQLSLHHFCRAFRQSFGMPPHRYHLCRRIDRAKQLLLRRERSIAEIAFDLGFNESSSFSAAFRKMTGVSPSEFLRGEA